MIKRETAEQNMENSRSYWVLHDVRLMRHPGWVLHLEHQQTRSVNSLAQSKCYFQRSRPTAIGT